jgi:hypothetical protein
VRFAQQLISHSREAIENLWVLEEAAMPTMTPVNMSVEGVHAAAGMAASQPIPVAPSADALNNWTQENYSLSVSAAADLGFDQLHGFHLSRNWFRGRSGPDRL